MPEQRPEIILHAYPQSPVAEKVRVVLGIKGLAWRSVEIPRLPPKPLLTALTGGNRRTPVMQIGADIFCDSQCILRALEQRFPPPSIMPTADTGLMWCLSRWTDGSLFDLALRIVLGAAGDNLDQDFAADRGRLYLGEDWAQALKNAGADLPHLLSQIRAPLSWPDTQLGDGRRYFLGDDAAAIDAQIYHIIWLLRGRWSGGPAFLAAFPNLERWESRVCAIGHGTSAPLDAHDAIIVAKSAETVAPQGVAAHEPQALSVGQNVTISPDLNGGEQPVAGTIHFIDAETVVIARSTPDVGRVCVHFPRAGYRITVQDHTRHNAGPTR